MLKGKWMQNFIEYKIFGEKPKPFFLFLLFFVAMHVCLVNIADELL